MKIESHRKIKPEYQHLVGQYEKHIKDLTQLILDKYDKPEYYYLRLHNPDVLYRTIQSEILQATDGVRKQYVKLLAIVTENIVVVKF